MDSTQGVQREEEKTKPHSSVPVLKMLFEIKCSPGNEYAKVIEMMFPKIFLAD
jgi:hypothetical protein